MTGEIALVTGGGSGIGKAAALTYAELGATVVIADLSASGAQATADGIRAAGKVAVPREVDITDFDAVRHLAADIEESVGPVSILANVAGWSTNQPFMENPPELWHRLVAINYLGTVQVCHAFLGPMIERRRGRVVNVGSDAGRVGSLGDSVYAGAKGAVLAFTKSLAREMARFDITVNCVCPGPTDTPLYYSGQPERMQERLASANLFRRLGTAQEVADAIVYLASSRASFITGQVLSASGGLTMV
ncbi:SDR family NAD(P)-dependent oxidoreductase [Mycobacterium vicinigordonae]|uniref:SDR family oxidoreductase n=1 Tax=Mycobacterium vicinigordonae TaxID=1719132 RepID=A0A7D6I9L3_9MYCO|nr:SDR family NAD(P)-dependent oxidoreductase [Mycobacterium vicinigordonae]QLL10538.1 SDR family oxidoreductase [Mycobacterium vicinigordonae]